MSTMSAPNSVAVPLTRRQIEVLRLVAHGYSDAQIGERLCISASTVSKHLFIAYLRIGLKNHNRVLLAIYAIQSGLITLDEIQLEYL